MLMREITAFPVNMTKKIMTTQKQNSLTNEMGGGAVMVLGEMDFF